MRKRVMMLRVVWWTCAYLALAGARVYERCELARELKQLGIEHKHISTWVCIAFHESRLDTTSQNLYSGDHGLLQISELYWCGAGKACGLPCSALRDDDISDDVECAQRIYEEHTRIQGDGFLAWVVYPQYCKQNTKKYLIDCDGVKNVTRKVVDRLRSFSYSTDTSVNETAPVLVKTQNVNIDELKPPYLTISSVIQGSYGNELEQINYYRKYGPRNWLTYKIDNIDDLQVPLLNKEKSIVSITVPFLNKEKAIVPTTTTVAPTTTTKTPRPTVRYQLETNDFRKKLIPSANSIFSTTSKNYFSYITTTARPTTRSVATTTFKPFTLKPTTTYTFPTTRRTTGRPTTKQSARKNTLSTNRYIQTTRKPPFGYNFTTRSSTISPAATKQSLQGSTATRSWETRSWTVDKPRTSTPVSFASATKTTQSIFDLYLNSRRPTLATYRFSSVYDDRYKLKIFSGGTTTPVPSYKNPARSQKYPTGGATRNQFKRSQTEA